MASGVVPKRKEAEGEVSYGEKQRTLYHHTSPPPLTTTGAQQLTRSAPAWTRHPEPQQSPELTEP